MTWEGLERHHIALKLPLLLVRGPRGVLACGYLNVETFNKTGEYILRVLGGILSPCANQLEGQPQPPGDPPSV
jgi:hypothetical protein